MTLCAEVFHFRSHPLHIEANMFSCVMYVCVERESKSLVPCNILMPKNQADADAAAADVLFGIIEGGVKDEGKTGNVGA